MVFGLLFFHGRVRRFFLPEMAAGVFLWGLIRGQAVVEVRVALNVNRGNGGLGWNGWGVRERRKGYLIWTGYF